MALFRPDRNRTGEDPLLGQKMLLFVIGAVLGITGIALDQGWLIWLALAFLAAGALLRLLQMRRERL